MSDDLRWPGIPESVHRRIARGEVPPPRDMGDPPDPIRDLRLSLAVAEAEGDMGMVSHLNAKWLALQREGHNSDTWQPKPPPGTTQPSTRSELLDAARRASERGHVDEANRLHLSAATAQNPISDETAQAMRDAEASGDWDAYGKAAVHALYEGAGEDIPEPIRTKPDYAATLSVPELHEARERAEAAGDLRESNRLNAILLGRAKARKERVVDFHAQHTAEATTEHAAFVRDRSTQP